MTLSYEQALDEIFGLFNQALQSNATDIIGSVPLVYYPGIVLTNLDGSIRKPKSDEYWLRAVIQEIESPQTSLSAYIATNSLGANLPASRFTSSGILGFQLFGPMEKGDSIIKLRKLGQVIRKAYRGKKTVGGAIFRNIRIVEIEVENSELWNRLNVVAEYEYDEVA